MLYDMSDTNNIRVMLNTMGVFQGSAPGPLLFTIHANDLSLYVPDAHVTQDPLKIPETLCLMSKATFLVLNLIHRIDQPYPPCMQGVMSMG